HNFLPRIITQAWTKFILGKQMRARPRLVMSQRTCTTNSDSYQFLVALFAGAAEGFRQGFKQVGCDERMFTDCFTSHIPCQAVKSLLMLPSALACDRLAGVLHSCA